MRLAHTKAREGLIKARAGACRDHGMARAAVAAPPVGCAARRALGDDELSPPESDGTGHYAGANHIAHNGLFNTCLNIRPSRLALPMCRRERAAPPPKLLPTTDLLLL